MGNVYPVASINSAHSPLPTSKFNWTGFVSSVLLAHFWILFSTPFCMITLAESPTTSPSTYTVKFDWENEKLKIRKVIKLNIFFIIIIIYNNVIKILKLKNIIIRNMNV